MTAASSAAAPPSKPSAAATRRVAKLRAHPQNDAVPALSGEAYAALSGDIATRDMQVPLEVTAEGVVLDGHARLRAARELGIDELEVRVLAPGDELEHMAATNPNSPEPAHRSGAANLVELAVPVLPPASAEERAQLRASIATDGVLVPIVRSSGPARPGAIADGELRAALALELGLECAQEEQRFASELEFQLYRLRVNLHRRQLPPAQRIRIGLALEPAERELAAQRKAQAQGGRRGQKTLPVGLPEEKGETRERIARAVGMRPSTYSRGAKVLREGSPRLVDAFEAGNETVNSAYRKLRLEQQRRQKLALAAELQANPLPLPKGRYQVLAIDPPWPEEGELPYPTMTLEQIAALPIPELLAEDAIVWLWTTNRFLFDAERLARECWQLERRGVLTWAKDRPGTGHWLRGQTEHCLLLTQGKPLFLNGISSLLNGRVREHSRKPDEFFDLVEKTSPGSKLELFAREPRPGWDAWGAEPNRFPPAENGPPT